MAARRQKPTRLADLCGLAAAPLVLGAAFADAGADRADWSRKDGEIRPSRTQSAVMPASLTTFAHSATSSLMMSANCPSGAPFGSHPAVSSFS